MEKNDFEAEKCEISVPEIRETDGCEVIGEIKQQLADISQEMQNISEVTAISVSEIKNIHKLFHNEFSGRLLSMQEKLDSYQDIEKGRIYDEILRDIAKIYVHYITIIDEISDTANKKVLTYLFEDILQVLESYNVTKLSSFPGDKRNTRHCQIREKIHIDDPTLHDTVVASQSAGFYIENRTLVKEIIDVYIHKSEMKE